MLRYVARACAVALVAGAGVAVPLPRHAHATTIRTGEVAVGSLPAGARAVPLPFTAHHVALHWAGAPDADVEVAFRTGGGPWRATYEAGRDDGTGSGGRTYGTVLGARDATHVLVTSDRPVVDLRVVAFGEGSRVRVPRVSRGVAAAADQPDVVGRTEWDPANQCAPNGSPSFAPIRKLAVHHTAGGEAADPKTTVKAICLFHRDTNGWNDIGYNFLVDSAGRVYEGRKAREYAPGEEPTGENLAKEGVVGAHVSGYNTGSVGVALLGDFTSGPPTAAARAGLVQVLAWKAARHGIDPLASSVFGSPAKDLPNVFAHRDAGSTACPGEQFYPQLPAVRQQVADRITYEAELGEYTAVTPRRVRDTRGGAAVRAGQKIDVQVTGVAGVPATGVGAVAVNVTAVTPTNSGYLNVWPAGESPPYTSMVSFAAGRTVAGFVKAKVSASGRISISNSAGQTHVLVDLVGWYGPAGAVPRSRYVPLAKPVRFVDTRPSAAVGPRGTVSVQAIRDGVAPDATALVLNLTVTAPTATSYVSLYPTGGARPVVSNLNFVPRQTVANAAVVGIGGDGTFTAYNFNGSTHLVLDVVGYFAPPVSGAGRLQPLSPTRVLDTRKGLGMPGPLGPGATGDLAVLDASGLPAEPGSSIVLVVTVTAPTASGFLTVWPGGEDRPLASVLNFAGKQTITNLVVARIGADGRVSFFNPAGTTHVIADAVGFYV